MRTPENTELKNEVDLSSTLEGRLEAAVSALMFYACPQRYEGPNQRPLVGDPHQPSDMVYRLDVTRDEGRKAREALKKLGLPVPEYR